MTVPCLMCGEPVEGRADKVYCSDSCRNKAWASRRYTLDQVNAALLKANLTMGDTSRVLDLLAKVNS